VPLMAMSVLLPMLMAIRGCCSPDLRGWSGLVVWSCASAAGGGASPSCILFVRVSLRASARRRFTSSERSPTNQSVSQQFCLAESQRPAHQPPLLESFV